MRKRSPKQVANDAKSAERRARALDLKKAGLTYRQIASQGREKGWAPKAYGEAQAYRDVKRELDHLAEECHEAAEQVRQLELTRLDRLQVALEGRIRDGDPQAINTAIRLSESRRRLLGLDAPDKQEVEHKGGVTIHIPDQYQTGEEWEAASGD